MLKMLTLLLSLITLPALAIVAVPMPQTPPVVAPVKDVPAPLTADEKKDIDLLTLKAQLASATKMISDLQAAVGACQGQLGPAQFEQNKQALTAEQAALKDAIEKARPGWTWNAATGAFTKKPDPPKTAEK